MKCDIANVLERTYHQQSGDMHQLGILDEVRERLILRRGGVAVFDRLSPRRTAHIVIDLQNGFMAPGQELAR